MEGDGVIEEKWATGNFTRCAVTIKKAGARAVRLSNPAAAPNCHHLAPLCARFAVPLAPRPRRFAAATEFGLVKIARRCVTFCVCVRNFFISSQRMNTAAVETTAC
ncbi:hypothetical protein EVAR_28505_1 [Eumeta japonica]|uniref:Uncharacterized protein n=1 Tax=Eumeta variegata TaxID=151549 RepID=A0A4C1WQ97_EUMVA|nr:hypothetical protein EVAR_28505_1 [Eumeta japonica]